MRLQGVSVARVGRMRGEQGRKATAPWLQVLKDAEQQSSAPPRYTHSLADEIADWAGDGNKCAEFSRQSKSPGG